MVTATEKKRGVQSLMVSLLNALDDFIINKLIGLPLPPSIDPNQVLSGNFAPVDELPPTECEVIEGSLPLCLHGAYIRNGPNPQFYPRGPYHLFDGDGMLHSIRISHNRPPVLCSRYVKTYKYLIEKRAGSPLLPNLFAGFRCFAGSAAVAIARVLTGQFDPVNGISLANTSVAFFGGHLYALAESDLPYAVRLTADGDIETVGRWDFDGNLSTSMTAHPKIDPSTGEAFAFRYSHVPPYLTYFRFDSRGKKHPDVPISSSSLSRPSLFHDFAITNKYAIFPDIQLLMNPVQMMMRGGSPVGADPTKVPRLGIIPRYAKDESQMRWFEVPGFNILHAINAWDEEDGDGDSIVMVAPNILPIKYALERMDLIQNSLEKVRIDLKTGRVSRHRLSQWNLEFAVINPGYLGKKNKYVYAAVGDPFPKISGIVKLDISRSSDDGRCQECTVAKRMYGPGCYGGEPFFVAKEPDNPEAEEDDGYVLSYIHDETSGESRFLVMDAQSPDLHIVAAVKLPSRVPYGFHGLFVRESDLKMD